MYVCVWLSLRRKMYILSCYILPHLFYLPWHYVRVTGLYKSGCFLSNSGFFVCLLLGSTAHVTENSASRDHRPGHLQVQHWLCWKQLSLKTCQNGWLLDCSKWRPGEKMNWTVMVNFIVIFFKYFVYTTSWCNVEKNMKSQPKKSHHLHALFI